MNRYTQRLLAAVMAGAAALTTTVTLLPAASAAVATSRTPAAAAAALTAPTAVTVTRVAGTPNNFTVSWSAPTAGTADHYVVTIFADGQETATTVKGSVRSVVVTGHTLTSIYQIRVGARTVAGDGDDSAQFTLEPVLPGAPINVTAAPSTAAGGIGLTWTAPGRSALSVIDHYHVVATDRLTGIVTTRDVAGTGAGLTTLDQSRSYLAAVTAVTKDGSGLTETAEIGGTVPTTPRGVTAVRDPLDATKVVISWDVPSYPGASPVTGYQLAAGTSDSAFTALAGSTAATGTAVVPLATTASGFYAVRAVNTQGTSVPSAQAFVPTLIKTLTPSSAYPVSVTVNGRVVTSSFVGHLGAATDTKLILRLQPQIGWTYRDEQIIDNGADPSASLSGVATGRYYFTVAAYNPTTKIETQVLGQDVLINDSSNSETATQASFSAGIGLWTGVYPAKNLPRVVTSNEVVFDGATSMAITAAANSVGDNVSVGTNGQRGVPVTAGQQLVVSAQGLITTPASRWNVGISWWDASLHQIAIVRTPQTGGSVGTWKESAQTFTAPKGAVLATAFVEVGDLLAGQTAYIDGISLRSTIEAPHPETPADWIVVHGVAIVSGSAINVVPGVEVNVIDPFVQSSDVTVNSTGQLVSGAGYGIWVRASWTAASQMSGYDLQFDHQYGDEFVLRHTYLGKECTVPVARAKFPVGVTPFGVHQMSVTIKGDTFSSTVDGVTALNVPSLSKLLATETCKFPAPTGTAIGYRVWSSTVTISATVRTNA